MILPVRPWRDVVVGASILCLTCGSSFASQFIYTPRSPAFGGNPLNGPFILGEASANNFRFTQNPATQQQSALNPVQQFKTEITSALLSQIAAQIGNQILGENARQTGTFSVGGELIQFARAGGEVNINITDSATGGTTNIQIPVPTF